MELGLHLLLHLLSSDDEEKPQFAVNKIIEMRGESQYGDKSLRYFPPPSLNWSAKKIQNMISWDGATEPIYTGEPFTMNHIPYHTQAVERIVKEVSTTSANVFGAERRHGYYDVSNPGISIFQSKPVVIIVKL